MSDELAIKGRCLCGAVEVSAYPVRQAIAVCHCRMCRRWAGGPFMAVECHDGIELHGERYVTRFASSAWAHRAFCNQCGSNLYFRMNDHSFVALASGLFELGPEWPITDEVFTEEKPGHYASPEASGAGSVMGSSARTPDHPDNADGGRIIEPREVSVSSWAREWRAVFARPAQGPAASLPSAVGRPISAVRVLRGVP